MRHELGTAIREDRQRQGLSIFRLAVISETSVSSINLAERGATSLKMLEKISAALKRNKAHR
jgi:transcriptional regulator with XRE-family HTH domain